MNGGYAFPAHHFHLSDEERGMTLRDYFAASAINGMLARNGAYYHPDRQSEFARIAYAYADAVLAERAK